MAYQKAQVRPRMSLRSQPCLLELCQGQRSQSSRCHDLGSLSLCASGLSIIQGVLLSQADVGTEGLSEPLTEQRCLPTRRCFQKQEAAVDGGQRVKESLPLCLPSEQNHVADKLRLLISY